jgi:hypothetical protein
LNTKQQIAFLDTTITELKTENLNRFREHELLTSSVSSIEKCQEELKEQAMQRSPPPSHSHSDSPSFCSIESDVLELKRGLISKGVLPERSVSECDDVFNGVIAFLTRDCGGNVSDCGIVEIRSSSVFDENCLPKNAANFALGSPIFQSKGEMNQWIEWDFKTSQIEPTHYSIRTHGQEAGHIHLRH